EIQEETEMKSEKDIPDKKVNFVVKLDNFRKKYKKLLISIFIIGLLFPTAYLIYRFHDNSHAPKTGLVNSANYINEQITLTPLSSNQIVAMPTAGGLLLNTSNWVSLYAICGNTTEVLDLLYYNLTYFCLNTIFAQKECAQSSTIFKIALENSTFFYIDKTFSMDFLISFDDTYYIYKIVST
ncbi:MAG: hypothetical protein KAR08_10625, partial [Candidatus Heimdallarchaeota archaeon]|nr:hypothetical protein [Candidatus Heimdallarchaeota archaeon]